MMGEDTVTMMGEDTVTMMGEDTVTMMGEDTVTMMEEDNTIVYKKYTVTDHINVVVLLVAIIANQKKI
jgi:hypothetical protein